MIFKERPVVTMALTAVLLATNFLPAVASAQNNMQELLNRIDRVQRELSTLQRHVFKDTVPTVSEGRHTAIPRADASSMARQSIRISQMESEMRRLTGRIEKIDFLISRIESRLDKLVGDLDQRFALLEEKSSQVTRSEGFAPPSSGSIAVEPSVPTATRSGVLGTIPKNLAVTSPRGPIAPPSEVNTVSPAYELPPGTSKSQYEYALSLMLKQQDFSSAENALKAFLEKHPQDRLASNAQYWLGETHYVRKNYQDAAFAFAEGYKSYPESRKAPDSLLKLGMSLGRMKKWDEACTAFSRILSKYPKATDRLKARIDRERRRAKCR